ncbi:hypothetical protein EV644_101817 [Kribbella orskensis]|uniref:Uncharacterized protein n=1 Tax=Kribbella orskensis TaxID=2512216 RepID=A0ABY2BVS7_9ACTN|nr:hypothetical protein EV642_101172 [Kribbella sp. VKM Ac-2500]TCO32174.1 hypothetical protein EV644_101817 [Kribbella orskensis]
MVQSSTGPAGHFDGSRPLQRAMSHGSGPERARSGDSIKNGLVPFRAEPIAAPLLT